MSDITSGIKIIMPTYPVKPVQPSGKDRESGKRKSDKPLPARDVHDDDDNVEHNDDDNGNPKIDEYV